MTCADIINSACILFSTQPNAYILSIGELTFMYVFKSATHKLREVMSIFSSMTVIYIFY